MALILFVEYHVAFRQAASYLMDQEPDLEVVSQAGSVADGRQRMAARWFAGMFRYVQIACK
jgi:hypothetical protein